MSSVMSCCIVCSGLYWNLLLCTSPTRAFPANLPSKPCRSLLNAAVSVTCSTLVVYSTHVHAYTSMIHVCVCADCGKTCHPKCSDQIPNNCGLPEELVDFDLSRPSSAKKLKWADQEEEGGQQEERGDKRGEQASGRSGGVVKSVSLIRRREETIKMGRVFVPKYVFQFYLTCEMVCFVLRSFILNMHRQFLELKFPHGMCVLKMHFTVLCHVWFDT